MTLNPLRRAAAVVAISTLALGGGAVAAHAAVDEPTPTVSAEPSATTEPSPTAEPSVTAEPTEPVSPAPGTEPEPAQPVPTSAPAPAQPVPSEAPEPEPTSSALPVPTVTVTQPTCNGLNAVRNGTITVDAVRRVDWAIAVDVPLEELDDDDIVLEVEEPGLPGTAEVAPGEYVVLALPWSGAFGDLGPWQAVPDDVLVLHPVTITALAGSCPAAAELTDANRGGFTAPATVTAGNVLVLSGLDAGARLRGYLFSVGTDLGAATVAADGTLRLTVPASVAAGTHRVALYAADGTLLGWQTVQVLASGQQLAVTGVDPLAGLAVGVVLVAVGGALVVARRRKAGTSA